MLDIEHFERLVRDKIQAADALQGERAFAMTRRATALHEAGHAIINKSRGFAIPKMQIRKELREGGRFVWIGCCDTNDLSEAPVDKSTSLQLLFEHAMNQLSGWASELLFDTEDFRLGISAGEKVMFDVLCITAAEKLRCPLGAVVFTIYSKVFGLLKQHQTTHAKLAGRLYNAKVLRGKEIAKLLEPVPAIQIECKLLPKTEIIETYNELDALLTKAGFGIDAIKPRAGYDLENIHG